MKKSWDQSLHERKVVVGAVVDEEWGCIEKSEKEKQRSINVNMRDTE